MNPEIQGQKPCWDTNRFTCLEFIKLLLELCYYEFVWGFLFPFEM
jgi:hypothetical protein